MSRTTALRRVSSLPFQKLNDEVLVVDPRTREVHLLNFTATRIWDLLAKSMTADELVASLAEEFDASPEALRADVESLLTELGAKGLVGADAVLEPEPPTDGDDAGASPALAAGTRGVRAP